MPATSSFLSGHVIFCSLVPRSSLAARSWSCKRDSSTMLRIFCKDESFLLWELLISSFSRPLSVAVNLSASFKIKRTSRGAFLRPEQYTEHCTPTLMKRSATATTLEIGPRVSAIALVCQDDADLVGQCVIQTSK